MIPAETTQTHPVQDEGGWSRLHPGLADELGVSGLTVRRDLKRMADEGLLVRT